MGGGLGGEREVVIWGVEGDAECEAVDRCARFSEIEDRVVGTHSDERR